MPMKSTKINALTTQLYMIHPVGNCNAFCLMFITENEQHVNTC